MEELLISTCAEIRTYSSEQAQVIRERKKKETLFEIAFVLDTVFHTRKAGNE